MGPLTLPEVFTDLLRARIHLTTLHQELAEVEDRLRRALAEPVTFPLPRIEDPELEWCLPRGGTAFHVRKVGTTGTLCGRSRYSQPATHTTSQHPICQRCLAHGIKLVPSHEAVVMIPVVDGSLLLDQLTSRLAEPERRTLHLDRPPVRP